MGLGLGFGAFVSGATEGYDKSRQRAMQDEKMDWERADQKEKADMRIARTDLSNSLKSIEEEKKKSLELINENAAYGRLPGSPDNVIEQAPQATQQTAIAGPEGTSTAPAAKPAEDPRSNPFKAQGEGRYKDQKLADDARYQATRDALATYYTKIGQPDKVLVLDKAVNEMREAAYDPVRKNALAMIQMGAPGSMAAATKFANILGLGHTFEGGEYDPKNHAWSNVKVTDANGKSKIENISVAQFGTVLGGFDFAKGIEYKMNRSDTERKFAIDDKNADSNRISANASATKAGAESRYADARVDAINNDAKGADAKARVEAVNKFFPNADKVLKIDESLGMSEKEIAGKKSEIETDNKGRTIAGNLASLNPKADLRVIAGFSRAAAMGSLPEKQIDKESGRTYITHGGTKIFVN